MAVFIKQFVWSFKKTSISFLYLNKPSNLGEFGLPDLKAYYEAAQLRISYIYLKHTDPEVGYK